MVHETLEKVRIEDSGLCSHLITSDLSKCSELKSLLLLYIVFPYAYRQGHSSIGQPKIDLQIGNSAFTGVGS